MKKEVVSYLDQLKFDPKLWKSIQAKYVVNFRLVIMLIISIVLLGLYSFFNIPRRLNPEVKIPIILVNTVLPGASPEEVESLVTIPLEDKLSGIKGLDTINSTSGEGISSIQLSFLSSVDVEKARTDTQSLVDQVNNLPTDAKTPNVSSIDFENQPVWTFAITSTSDYASLARFAELLEERIKNASKVDRVALSGLDEQEIEVVINLEKIRTYGLSPIQLSQAVSKAASSYPAGNVTTDSSAFSLAINKDITSVNDIRNLYITTPTGEHIQLGNIASVSLRSKPDQGRTFYATSQVKQQAAVQFSVYKISSANIDEAEEQVHQIVDDTIKEYNGRFELVTVTNNAEEISEQFSDLFSEFRSTVILVFVLLLIFLGFRQAVISSLTVPLTFLSTFAIISAMGLSLNFLTLFAFLIALGLLIDDTIVTVAAMTRYYKTDKFTPAETGILVWKDFFVPLWSTTLTTIWAFLPLLIASGIIGEFIKSIPIVVTATLLSSTSIAVLITLPLMIVFLKPQLPKRVSIMLRILGIIIALAVIASILPKTPLFPIIMLLVIVIAVIAYRVRETFTTKLQAFFVANPKGRVFADKFNHIMDNGLINIEALSLKYMGIIRRVLDSRTARRNVIVAIISFAVAAYLLVPLGLVTNEFFPKTNEDIVYVNVELPSGSNISRTKQEQISLLEKLRKTEGVNFIVAETSAGSPTRGGGGNANTFLFTLHLVPSDDREITSQELAQKIRDEYREYSVGKLSVEELSGGPPAGSDIQIKLLGEDLGVLNQYADTIELFLKQEPGITNVSKSVKAGTSKLTFVPDKSKIAENGLSVDAVALWLRTYASGFTLSTIKLNNEDNTVMFRTDSNINTPEGIAGISIPVQSAGRDSGTQPNSVPLLSLGSIKLENNPTQITREDGKRTISVSAGVTAGVIPTEKNKKLEEFADTLNLPNGYAWKTGGVNEENTKSVQSILQAMVISLVLILVTMVVEFKSFRQALMALLLIPLSIPGVFYVFALAGIPLSFPALIGILALFGIIVTHAIVVIEKINDNRKEGLPLKEAIIDAAGNRLEPVLLTSLATIVGLIPITIADPLWRGLGGAIIAGLMFSGLIKLFFVPIVYYAWFRADEEKELKKKVLDSEQSTSHV